MPTESTIGSFQSGSRAVIRTKTVYDANGRVVALINDRGAQTSYQYDLLDRQTSMTFQDGSTRSSMYDLANDLTGYTDENGSVFANTFDSLGRRTATAITSATGVVGTTAQSFQYDGLSRLTFARDTVGSTNVDVNFYYDSINRVVEESQKIGTGSRGDTTHSKFTSYVVTELTYPSATTRKVTYGYDSVYRRNSIQETSTSASIAAWEFFGYRTALTTLGNGITCSFMNNAGNRSAVQAGQPTPPWGATLGADHLGYDGSGRMIAKRYLSISDTPNAIGFTTEYDPAGNKLYERALHAESRSALYPSYDSINRLLEYQRGVLASGGESVTTPITLPDTDSQRSYDLDHLGNWKKTLYTHEGGSAATEVRRHNLVNEVTLFGTTPVLYDHGNNAASPDPLVQARGNGNIVNDGTLTYQYDALNRLTTVKSGSTTVSGYTYDALGRSVANLNFRYLYEGQQIVEVRTTDDFTTHQHVWGQYIDELVQLTGYNDETTTTDYCLQDLLYRSIALTSSSATIVEAYDYDAYGNTLMYNAGSGGAWFTDGDTAVASTNNPFLFTGRQYDFPARIYNYRARFYHPRLGRFLSRDPIVFDGSMGLYEYVSSMPARGLDPLGLVFIFGQPGGGGTSPPIGDSYWDRPRLGGAPADTPANRMVMGDNNVYQSALRNYGEAQAYKKSGDLEQAARSMDTYTKLMRIARSLQEDPQLGRVFANVAQRQWDCYSNCMKDALWALLIGGGLGAAPDIPLFYKPLSYPFLDPGNYEMYMLGGKQGALRAFVAAVSRNMGWNGIYQRLMAGRGLALSRAGGNPIMAHGGSGAARGGLAALAVLSTYCSIKCYCDDT